MFWWNFFASPVRLLAVFVLLAGIPLAALGWLGYRVVQQDRVLENQRAREQLDNTAAVLARELDRALIAWEDLLPAAARGESVPLPPGAVFLSFSAEGVGLHQGVPLPFYPRLAPPSPTEPTVFAYAEELEFRAGNLAAAASGYRDLAASRDESVRAGALVRLARCLRKERQTDAALDTYASLVRLGGVVVAGAPAELVGRRERIGLFAASGRPDEANEERASLTAALADGRFRIDKPTFEYFHESTESPDTSATALAAAVEALWPTWLDQSAGRRTTTTSGTSFVSVWRDTSSGRAAITAPLDLLTATIGHTLQNLPVAAQIDDGAGTAVWGRLPAGSQTTRTARETGLPWTLHVAATNAYAGRAIADSRRNLFLAGFLLMALVISASGYFVFRAVTRELGVARLQSDFVAAVSHEFRSPLTAMCHLTEMLEDGIASAERLPDYYRALGRESRRLHAMVENLLDFGRMDSGRRTYEFAPTDAVALLDRVATEYAERSPRDAPRIEQATPPIEANGLVIHADAEALALAVRNLLDNAMKYSPESSPVRLGLARRHGGVVALSIEDRGGGVSKEERRAIFRKFTRGTAARALNVKGTGIGLTMAEQIVKAHGGRLELESEPGCGTTFTIVLPAQEP